MTYLPNAGRVNVTIGGNTAGIGSLISTGTATLVGGNNITLSQNGNAVTISGAAGGGAAFTAGMSNIGNTTGTSGTVSNQLIFAGGNNITLSQVTGAGGNTISISGATTFPAFSAGINTIGNTSGTTGMASNQVVFAGGNNVTLSQVTGAGGNTVTIVGASAFSAGISSTLGNTSGTTGMASNQLVFAGGSNITLSQSTSPGGNTITIIGTSGGGGVALAGGGTTFNSGTVNLVASGALTIGTAAQSFNLSVPQTSSLMATGILSLSTNGSTISIGVPGAGTLSRFEYPDELFTSLGGIGQGSLSINHMYVPFNVVGSAMKIGGLLTASTTASASTGSANLSLWMGLYTLIGSTLSLMSSGSANNGFQWFNTSATTANTSVQSMRQLTVPMNISMTPGEYWAAAVISSATTYTSAGFTIYGNNLIAGGAANAVLSPIGSNTSVARDAMLFQGIYTANTSAGPATMGSSQINITSASNVQRANFYNAIYSATY